VFNAQHDDFHITSFQAYKAVSKDIIGRDQDWKSLAEMTGLIGVSCTHLGGDSSVEWIIKVDKGIRGEATGNMYTVKANGGDMYYTPNPAQYTCANHGLVSSAIIGCNVPFPAPKNQIAKPSSS
jgi:hypothetical protein